MKKFYQNLIDKSLNFCSKKSSGIYLYLISFFESIFFPIPTDIFLFPYVIANSKKYIKITIFVTLFSVFGGVIAYLIGFFVWYKISPFLLEHYPSIINKLDDFESQFLKTGIILILIGGISPFPYKITCIGSGILGINLTLFIISSIISRGIRFFVVSYLIYKYGEQSLNFIRRYILRITLFLLVLIILTLLI